VTLSENVKLTKDVVGRRFPTLDKLKNKIEMTLNRKIQTIIESESEREEEEKELDFMIDYCFEDDPENIETLYYLKDNGGWYYITGV